jgi:polysaccharide chain length determinant protein (PEP-CTERM system associated)
VSNALEARIDDARRILRVTAQHRWIALGTGVAVWLVAATGIEFIQDRYQATARVYVDTQTVLKPLMQSLTFQPDIEQQVSMLARTLISRPNVEALVERPELRLERPGTAAHERMVSNLMADIRIAPSGVGNLYDISYKDADADRARRVVAATVGLFIDSDAGAKKRDSADAGRFIDEQIRDYESKLTASESRLKDFKIAHFGVSGVSNQDYFSRVSALTDEVSRLRVDLAAAGKARDAYRLALASEDPRLPGELVVDGATGVHYPVAEQRRLLEDLLRRDTESHPDVINARRALAQLEAQAADGDPRAQPATPGGRPGSAPTNPVYQRLRISLAESEAQEASLRAQLGAKQALLDEVRSAAVRQPEAEAELVQLNRDYEIIRKNYDLMVARRESAQLGARLDESSHLAQFRVVDPPRVRTSPSFPSKLHLSLIAVLLSIMAGIGAAVARELAAPTVADRDALRKLSGRPVIGSVSSHLDVAGQQRLGGRRRRFAVATGLSVTLQACWVAWTFLGPHLP